MIALHDVRARFAMGRLDLEAFAAEIVRPDRLQRLVQSAEFQIGVPERPKRRCIEQQEFRLKNETKFTAVAAHSRRGRLDFGLTLRSGRHRWPRRIGFWNVFASKRVGIIPSSLWADRARTIAHTIGLGGFWGYRLGRIVRLSVWRHNLSIRRRLPHCSFRPECCTALTECGPSCIGINSLATR